jgi:release factor glutamine methyltransferase
MQSKNLYQELHTELLERWAGLPDKPDETPCTTLDTLWELGGGNAFEDCAEISPDTEHRLRRLVTKRLNGVPLSYLTGKQAFMGVQFLSSPQAMIPRKETEILGRTSLNLARSLARERGEVKVIDLCTGSGNIALTLAHYEPCAKVWGADLLEDAVQLAQRNAGHLGLSERVAFLRGDLFAPFDNEQFLGKMDLVTCNPPHIASNQVEKMPSEVIRHEPYQAFDGGHLGIKIITRLVHETPRFLKPGGWVCFEVGRGQEKGLLNLVNKLSCYQNVQTFPDEKGETRVLQAQLAYNFPAKQETA